MPFTPHTPAYSSPGGSKKLTAAEMDRVENALQSTTALAESAAPDIAALGWTPCIGTGIDPTGASDSTTAVQAKLSATPLGGTCYLPAGRYKSGALTIPLGVTLRGADWTAAVNALTTFGDANYLLPNNLAGSVILSTVTSGAAITIDPSTPVPNHLDGILIVGPGTGTATGILAGTTTHAPVGCEWRNVGVMNFFKGVSLLNVEDSRLNLTIRGCVTALTLASNTNNNHFDLLSMQRCTDGLIYSDATQLANTFTAMLCQVITGTGVSVQGESQVFINPYFEQVNTRLMDFATAKHCVVVSPSVQGPSAYNMRVQSGCFFNSFRGLNMNASYFTVANAGYGSEFSGLLTGLTDTGSNTHLIDLNNAIHTAPKFVATSTGLPGFQFAPDGFGARYGASGPQFRSGTGTPEGYVTAPVGSIYQRADGGTGTSFYVKEGGSATSSGWVAK